MELIVPRLSLSDDVRRPGIAAVIASLVASLLLVPAPSVSLSALLGATPFVSSPAADGGAGPLVREASDAATAALLARRQGVPVEVLGERTESRTVFATPEGTMSAELTPEPTRIERGATWVDIDTTLEAREDGLVAPKAAVGDLTLSGGGSRAPLMRLAKDGKTLAWHWPGTLPKPVLKGNEATYPEVFPGVDLVVMAESSGYRQHLVVKNAEAARNPALSKIEFRLDAPDLRLSVGKGGMLRADDDAGRPVFTAPPPTMWDANRRTADVGVEFADGRMTLVPDSAVLTDPGTVFPVTIDPDWRTFGWETWNTVLSGKPSQVYARTSGAGPNVVQVGRCFEDGTCDGIGIARAYFQFDTRFLAGKRIIQAAFETSVMYSPDCAPGGHNHVLSKSYNVINDGTTWDNQPWGERPSPVSIPKGGNAKWGCPAWSSAGFPVADKLTPGGPTTLLLYAENEAEDDYWRKYSPVKDPGGNRGNDHTRLTVHYNTKPNLPTNLRTIPNLPAPCRWCDGWSYFADPEIRFAATLSDPDPGDTLQPQWRVAVAGALRDKWAGNFLTNGVEHTTNFYRFTPDMDGKVLNWWLENFDGVDASASVGGPKAFVLDRTAPKKEPSVSATLYKEDNSWHGGPGVEDTFTFTADPADTDIDRYEYSWEDPPSNKYSVVAEGRLSGPAEVRLTPPGDGPRTLHVRSVDRAGNPGPVKHYRFYVRAGNGPYAHYAFEGNATDDAFLGDRDGTLHGGATYTPGAVGTALQLDGEPGTEMVADNVVRTDTGFTVSAWVRPDELPDTVMGVGGQDSLASNGSSGWLLNYRGDGADGPRWTFHVQSGDPAKAGFWYGMSTGAHQVPQKGKWTHLTGVYDRLARTVVLYVNGAPAGDPVRLPADYVPMQSGGPLVVGRNQWEGTKKDPWHGAIDEFGVYDRPLSDAEVTAMVSRDNVQTGHWQFEETTGTTAKNSVTGGDHGVLTGGAQFTDQGAVGRAVQLNGTNGQVVTNGPAYRTDQSFSVAAYVWADQFPGTGAMTAVSQDGDRNSGFSLQYNKTVNNWVFTKMSTDGDDPQWYGAEGPAAPTPATGKWVHLAGVFDGGTKQMRLFVDGAPGPSITMDKPLWDAQGKLVIGRGKFAGNERDFWWGKIDEVRTYSRVLSVEEIKGIIAQNNVTAGQWKFDGVATDSSSRALGGRAENGPLWGAGQTTVPDATDMSIQFDGTDDYVHALNTVNTSESFSVAGWARPDKPGSSSVLASQDGVNTAGFSITAGADGNWHLLVAANDQNPPAGTEIKGGSVQYGVWTHVAGVYNKQRQRIELYVNGVLAVEGPHAGGPSTTGELQIGRVKSGSAYTGYFAGAVDDVVAYTRPLFAEEIRTMAGRDLTLVHHWGLDEGSGTRTADAIGGRGATLTGGAGFTAGKFGNAVALDGRDDAVSTEGLELSTDKSFSISAWIWLDSAQCATRVCRKDAVSIDGGGPFSKLRLGYFQDTDSAPEGKWIFEMPEPNGEVTEAAVSRQPSEDQGWVFLTGVYDAPTQKIWLYVDANRIDDGTLRRPWKSTGGMRVGRGTLDNAPVAFWDGRVDEVRMYSAPLDKDRVTALFRSYAAVAPSPQLPVADAGFWKADENTATVAADSSGRGRNATMRGSASWGGGRMGTAVWMNGTEGYLETDGPVLTTNQSFSVTAWATFRKTATGNRVVLGQDRTQVSSFLLFFDEGTGKWAASAPSSDTGNPAAPLVRSATPAVLGAWTHLGVVYDARSAQLRLYVNGVLSGVQTGITVMDSAGKFSIGRGRWNNGIASFFTGGIDDVRAFGRALSDGEIRKVHDSTSAMVHGKWTFDGHANDVSWLNNPATVAGGTSYVAGRTGQALQLNGTTGAATTQRPSVLPSDSFTVSAWARINRTDQDATVVAQDGARRSGFVLQYNKNVGRWIFGAPVQDADNADLAYAYSAKPPQIGEWVHLTGIYDHAGRQFRLYVNGELSGVREGAQAGPSSGSLTIGRGESNGVAAGFFPGAIDEVQTDVGMADDAEIRARAGLN
ncbi:LamG domain-containing protein [Nonomuraea rubra]|uniref:LamG domain-containing protein n=1 Tax=Nonomuraea rubra TaxID=46180 RepID=UPI003325C912